MKNKRGQTALVLILLAAAALIFLAVTLNWGRIAQTKTLLTIAADQSATLLASDAASYGQAQKQTYLKDKNKLTESIGLFMALLMVIIAIIAIPFAFTSGIFIGLLAVLSAVMAITNLVLQAAVVQPMITSEWNKLMRGQPVPEQYYEGAIQTAFENSVTDQVKITDYLDWNAKGIAGNNSHGFPNDVVSRFAVFYTDRLKMINHASSSIIPQVKTFYTQLGALMNGDSNGFKLNDACPADSVSTDSTYSPYCDPCCQPNPPSTASCGNSNCLTNNRYGPSYPYLYDSSFQKDYTAGTSFLEQFGRDQQMGPFTSLTPNVISPNGVTPILEFPNGVYPFFWLMKDYSPQVDNLDPTTTPLTAGSPALHWCAPATTAANGVDIPSFTAPTGFTDLAQLTLPYTCQAQDCCVNYLPDTLGCCTSGVFVRRCPAPVNGVCPAGTTLTPTFDNSFKGTANGVIDMVTANPNPSFDSSFGASGSSSWVEGDNQICLTTWPYNGANSNVPDGTCELSGGDSATANSSMTIDALDDTIHPLSDFVNYATTFLGNSVGTLSSTFSTWYPQVAEWIGACDDGSTCSNGVCSGDGSSCVGRLAQAVANLNTWSGPNSAITNWLNTIYTSSSAWCVPPEATLLSESGPCDDGSTCSFAGQCSDGTLCNGEDGYINSNYAANDVKGSSLTHQWGDLGYVLACLNYNSNQTTTVGSVYNYQQCLNALLSGACSGALPAVCTASALGRSLIAGAAPSFDGCAGSYAAWVNNSLTLAIDEAPKFALRYLFLKDVYTRAQTLQTISSQGYTALSTFLDPDQNKVPMSPSAGLTWAFNHQTSASLPNSVIYGWVDATPGGSGGCWDATHTKRSGCAHIVKVTAYSPGRYGSSSLPRPQPASKGSGLPWIQTKTTGSFLGIPTSRSFTLMNRDGYVWVGVRRWDEDHSPILFPNGHTLWQSLFHNPIGGKTETGYKALPTDCIKLPLGSADIGFGLQDNTVTGLEIAHITSTDADSLGNAFMLNDKSLDPNETGTCANAANALLANALESHACAAYVASLDASKLSGNGDQDYSVRFVSDSLCAPQTD